MRIVLVNWAKIWDGASHGGGVNGYCQSLALAMMERGHEVISLVSGTAYLDPPLPRPLPRSVRVPAGPSIRRHEDWLGVKVFEVLNSPVMAPSIVQFKRPLQEASCPELERVVGDLFAKLKPDVVHFNNIEGFSAGCVTAAKNTGARVIYSLHNYHTICPQVYLMQGHRKPCFDYDNGHACATCIGPEDPDEERAIRSANWKTKVAVGLTPEERALHDAWGEFKHLFAWPVRVLQVGRRVLEARANAARARGPHGTDRLVPGLDLARTGHDAPLPVQNGPNGDKRGKTLEVLSERHGRPPVDPDHPTRTPLLNILQPDPPLPPSSKPLNDYGQRRHAMVDMLNACDHVLAVSDFVRRKFISMGVDEAKIEAMHIGTRITRIVELARELVFDPPPFERPPHNPRPIRLVFIGYNHYYKGLHVLAEALEALSPDQLSRIDLSIFALDGETTEHLFRRMEPRLARLTYTCGYGYHDIPWLLGGKDLAVVSSVWWDNAPQTVMEAMACGVPVLGSEIGGIPDFVTDGVNGLLFRANDHQDLARRLAQVLADPWMLTRLRANVRPPKSIEAHAAEMERVYAGTGPAADVNVGNGARGVTGRVVVGGGGDRPALEPARGPE